MFMYVCMCSFIKIFTYKCMQTTCKYVCIWLSVYISVCVYMCLLITSRKFETMLSTSVGSSPYTTTAVKLVSTTILHKSQSWPNLRSRKNEQLNSNSRTMQIKDINEQINSNKCESDDYNENDKVALSCCKIQKNGSNNNSGSIVGVGGDGDSDVSSCSGDSGGSSDSKYAQKNTNLQVKSDEDDINSNELQSFGCIHYKRRAMFVTPCCNKFYKCRFCHDLNESHHFDRKTLAELICSDCHTRQKVQERCENCNVLFGKYFCLICNLFDDEDKRQYHCNECGICRVGGAENFFHCGVCNMCLPIQLKIDGHRCVENVSRSHCPVCLGDIHTSRIPCHIPDCGHLLHKMCFDQLLASGHYTCPVCQTSLIDMTALWDYLDTHILNSSTSAKCDNKRVHIFCNDCQKTSNTKYHFIGLKCRNCGGYNTTQNMKRRKSVAADEATSA